MSSIEGKSKRRWPGSFKVTLPLSLFVISMVSIAAIWVDLVWKLERGGSSGNDIWELIALLTVYVVTEKIQALFSSQTEEDIKREITRTNQEIKDAVSQQVEVKIIGDHAMGVKYMAERIEKAKRIQDTFLRASPPDETLGGYPAVVTKYYQSLKQVVDKQGICEIVMSAQNVDVFVKMIENMDDNIREQLCHFKLWEIEHHEIPIPNVAIITYEDNGGITKEQKEVLFGWNFDDTDHGIALSSQDDRTIIYFERWFDAIKRKSRHIPPQQLLQHLSTTGKPVKPLVTAFESVSSREDA